MVLNAVHKLGYSQHAPGRKFVGIKAEFGTSTPVHGL